MSTDLRFTYPKPVKPPIVLALDAVKRTFNAGMRLTDQPGPGNLVDGLLIATRSLMAEMEIGREITDEDRADLDRYNRQVDAYNEAVRAHNAKVRALKADAEAKAAAEKIRNDRCNKCFMLHAPGQTECE